MFTLTLEKLGCDFGSNSMEAKTSDLENYCLVGEFDYDEIYSPRYIGDRLDRMGLVGDKCVITVLTKYYDSKTVVKDWRNKTRTWLEFSFVATNGDRVRHREYNISIKEPTKKCVVSAVNYLFGMNCNEAKIVERGAAALTCL